MTAETAIAKKDQFMTKGDIADYTKYVVAETKKAIMEAGGGQSIGGMSHAEAEMWAKTCISGKLYPQNDKVLTPTELVSRALIRGVAGSKYGMDFFESQSYFHILHDGKMVPDYKLRLAQIAASNRFRFRFEDDGETCTGIISELRDGAWTDHAPVSFSMADAKKAGLDSKDNWKKYPDMMRLARVAHRTFNLYCGPIKTRQDEVLYKDFEGEEVAPSQLVAGDDPDPFAVETVAEALPEQSEAVTEAESPESTPLGDFFELASVKFSDENGDLDQEAYDAFLGDTDPATLSETGLAELTKKLRTV